MIVERPSGRLTGNGRPALMRQAIAELIDLGRGYNQMIIDKYKELIGNGNA